MNILTLTSTNSRSGSTAASLVAPENSSTASCSKQWLSSPCRTIGWSADLATPNPNILGLTERSGYPLLNIVTGAGGAKQATATSGNRFAEIPQAKNDPILPVRPFPLPGRVVLRAGRGRWRGVLLRRLSRLL